MPRRTPCALLLAAALLTGCGNGALPTAADAPPSTPAATSTATTGPGETRDVGGFTAVELASVGDLRIEQSGAESLRIEAEAAVLPLLTSEVSGGVLRLGVVPGSTVRTSQPIVYHLTVATLDALTVSGAGDAAAEDLRVGRFTVDITGAGAATLGGSADSQVVTLRGTGEYDGEDLRSSTAEVTVDGAGSAVVHATDRLDVSVDGAGSVEYVGDPVVTQDVSGAGSVERR